VPSFSAEFAIQLVVNIEHQTMAIGIRV